MKLKLISLITGAVLLAATPFAMKTVAAPGQQLAQATTQQRSGRQNQLNLTSDQKEQMRQLHQETRQKIEALLSSDQLAKYKTAMQNRRGAMRDDAGEMNSASRQGNGNRRQNMFASLNLSQDQKAKIREIMQNSRTRMSSILTDAQRTQLQEMMRARKGQAQ
jgi:periplasmic protein CpxP/Spy